MKLTQEQKEKVFLRIQQASEDPVVFIDRFLYTFDPKRDPYHLPFRLFPFQKDLIYQLKEAIEQGHDIFIEKCREMGATYTVLDVFLWFWRYVPGSNFLLGSRKEQYVDNTKGTAGELSNKEESLFGKLEYSLNRIILPEYLLPQGFNMRKHLTYMSLLNPENGNVISGESSNENFSRGGRFKAIMLDEFAFWDNDTAAWGSTADTTNCRVVLTTPGIKPSKAKRLRYGKDGEIIKVITIPHHLDPRKDKEWLDRERARRSAEDFAREIMINWETSVAGVVYPEIEQAKAGDFPYMEQEALHTGWDFGLDGVAIQWWQRNPSTLKPRLIDCYFNENKPISFYFIFFGIEQITLDTGEIVKLRDLYTYTQEDEKLIEIAKTFKKPTHFGDPDVSKRSLLTGTSTRQALVNVGIHVITSPQDNDFISRREETKVMLQNGIEVNQNRRTDFFMECIRSARYPQREETSQATSAIKLPIHDYTSHHRTAMEYYAVNYSKIWENPEPKVRKPDQTYNTFAWHLRRQKLKRIGHKLATL